MIIENTPSPVKILNSQKIEESKRWRSFQPMTDVKGQRILFERLVENV